MKSKLFMAMMFVTSFMFGQEECFTFTKTSFDNVEQFEKNVVCLDVDRKLIRVNRDMFKVIDAKENRDKSISIIARQADELYAFTFLNDNSILIYRDLTESFLLMW